MKVALVADIHANFPALQAVDEALAAWRPDQVVVLGDTVNRGPHPVECLHLVQQRQREDGWLVIGGNHEEYVVSILADQPVLGSRRHDVHRHTLWTATTLGEQRVADVAQMPGHCELVDPAWSARFTHGSLLGNRSGVYPDTTDEELETMVDRDAALFGVGHTHRPLVRVLGSTWVVNAGSVGLPFDGDHRPCYVEAEAAGGGRWRLSVRRLSYDRERAQRDYREGAFALGSGHIGRVIQREFQLAHPLLASWTMQYQRSVLRGEIGIEEAVDMFLRALT